MYDTYLLECPGGAINVTYIDTQKKMRPDRMCLGPSNTQ
jgi:hypothetical protein